MLCVSYHVVATAQNLNSITAAKRDSILISIAKEVILKYGPDYYREYSKPIIEKSIVPPKGEINKTGKNAGRVSYIVTFLYDKTEETLGDYAAKVSIWGDTRKPSMVMFGNGMGIGISESTDWRVDTPVEPIIYQESIVPLYDINNHDPNQDPVNKDILIKKGFEKSSNGQWVKTRPDTPPAEALKVIAREKAKLKEKDKK